MATLRWLAKSKVRTESPIHTFDYDTCAEAVEEYDGLVHLHHLTATPASIVLEVRDNSGVICRHYSYAANGDRTRRFDHRPRR